VSFDREEFAHKCPKQAANLALNLASEVMRARILYEVCMREDADVTETIGLVEGLDLITLREKLRKHGVAR
jgi:hypothetical protein